MITVFNRACVYTGFDMKAFADIRAVLEQNNIPYRYKLRTRTGQWTPDGTIRAHAAAMEKMHPLQRSMRSMSKKVRRSRHGY